MLTARRVGSQWIYECAEAPQFAWAITPVGNGSYEASCGEYNLGTHCDKFDAFMVIMNDATRRSRGE